MKPLEVFIHDYGLTHSELAQLTGKHRTNVTKMISNARMLDNQTLSLCWNILLKINSMEPEALFAKAGFGKVQPPEWVLDEQLRLDVWQQKLTRLLGKMEKLQKQVAFWSLLCTCQYDLACKSEWLVRHQEDKQALLHKCWEHEYLPLLLKVRQCEARLGAWDEACKLNVFIK